MWNGGIKFACYKARLVFFPAALMNKVDVKAVLNVLLHLIPLTLHLWTSHQVAVVYEMFGLFMSWKSLLGMALDISIKMHFNILQSSSSCRLLWNLNLKLKLELFSLRWCKQNFQSDTPADWWEGETRDWDFILGKCNYDLNRSFFALAEPVFTRYIALSGLPCFLSIKVSRTLFCSVKRPHANIYVICE